MLIKRTLPPAATPIGVRDILNGLRGLISGKDEIERFRSELKNYFGVKHCFLVSSGKAALALILEALHQLYPDRTSVIIPAFTCYSVPSAVKRAGLEIKLCDIDPETLDFDYAQLESLLSDPQTSRILAVIPRHIFGLIANMDQLRRITDGFGVSIVEDAAQTMGEGLNGIKLGTLGDVGLISLGRGKAYSTVEGGIILTGRDDLADRINKLVEKLPGYSVTGKFVLLLNAVLLSVFMHPALFWLPKSLPFLRIGDTIYDTGFALKKLSTFQAGLARGWQNRLHSFIKARSENARYWRSCLAGAASIAKIFSDYGPGDTLKISMDGDSGPVRFAAVMQDEIVAKEILCESDSQGLGIMMTYPDSVAGIFELSAQFAGQRFPISNEYAMRMLTFPTHPYVSMNDKLRIAELLNPSFIKS